MLDTCTNDSDSFHLFFNQIDNYRERHFLYLTSKGLAATKYHAGQQSKARANAGKGAEKTGDGEAGRGGEGSGGDVHTLDAESDDEGQGYTKKDVEESG